VLRSGVTDGCQVTVMSAPCSCGVFTSTFSRRSRNTHVSFTPGRSTPVSLETFCEVKSVSRTGLAKLSRSKAGLARSSGVIRKITSTVNLVPKGGEGVRHGVAYGLPPADGLAARWVSTHLNPPRVRVIIATLVNRHPSLPGESASKVAMIGAWSLYSAHSSWSRVPHTYGLAIKPSDVNK
jgi:hypothetical protein